MLLLTGAGLLAGDGDLVLGSCAHIPPQIADRHRAPLLATCSSRWVALLPATHTRPVLLALLYVLEELATCARRLRLRPIPLHPLYSNNLRITYHAATSYGPPLQPFLFSRSTPAARQESLRPPPYPPPPPYSAPASPECADHKRSDHKQRIYDASPATDTPILPFVHSLRSSATDSDPVGRHLLADRSVFIAEEGRLLSLRSALLKERDSTGRSDTLHRKVWSLTHGLHSDSPLWVQREPTFSVKIGGGTALWSTEMERALRDVHKQHTQSKEDEGSSGSGRGNACFVLPDLGLMLNCICGNELCYEYDCLATVHVSSLPDPICGALDRAKLAFALWHAWVELQAYLGPVPCSLDEAVDVSILVLQL